MVSLIRNAVWFVKGLREYTRAGYETAAKRFLPSDLDVDCSAKSFVVTGANSGIGYVCALEIARRNGTVHLVCRNEERGNKAKEEIRLQSKNDKIHLHIVDLAEPKKIAEFAKSFMQSNKSLDVLVNNAGCMVNERQKTSDGLDVNFATNTLGFYVLTKGLVEALQRAPNPRVIFVTSGGMLTQKMDHSDLNFEKMNPYDGVMAYAQNKRQEVVICEQLAKAYPSIFFACMHPGWADTPGVRTAMPDFHKKLEGKWRTAEQGADTMVWLALTKAVEGDQSGEFYQDRAVTSKHLPLSWTQTSEADDKLLMEKLDQIVNSLAIEL